MSRWTLYQSDCTAIYTHSISWRLCKSLTRRIRDQAFARYIFKSVVDLFDEPVTRRNVCEYASPTNYIEAFKLSHNLA